MSKLDTTKTYQDFQIPLGVVSKTDLSRLVVEFEGLDNELTGDSVRAKSKTKHQHSAPVMSANLSEFIDSNSLSVTSSRDRANILKQLRILKQKVPVIHMTFATTADPQSLEKLTQWLRANIHSQAIINIGIQPDLVAGVYMRTPNHVHDFSLRGQLKDKHGVLVNELRGLRHV